MAERKRLGDILKEAGMIDEFQLQSALSHQRNWKGKLGAILVELGFIKESDLSFVLSEKLRIPRVDLFNPEIPAETIDLLKPDIVKKLNAVPVKVEGRVLTVAVSDPMDMESLDEVRFITGLAVKPALAMDSEIRDAIKKYYDHEQITHREALTIHEKLVAGPAKMEIMRDNPDMGRAAITGGQPAAAREAAPVRQEQVSTRDMMEALITLLIEKGLVTREELAGMLKHKKIGL
jgi:type IV pilus assembly protein PilB